MVGDLSDHFAHFITTVRTGCRVDPSVHVNWQNRDLWLTQEKIERNNLRMLQLDMFAEGKVDSVLHPGAHDRSAQVLMISILKLVPGELPLDFIGGRHKKGWNVVPKEINKLIVGHDDQYIRFRLLQIYTKYGKSLFGILSKLFLLF